MNEGLQLKIALALVRVRGGEKQGNLLHLKIALALVRVRGGEKQGTLLAYGCVLVDSQ